MITHEDLKLKIENSGWPPPTVATLISALPNIGQQSLNYLYTNFDVIGSSEESPILQLVTQIPKWRQEIETGQPSNLPAALVSALKQENPTNIELMSKFIYDLHANNVIARKLSPDLNRKLVFYQFAVLEQVSFKEIVLALTNYAVDLAQVLHLEAELKRFAYYKNYEPDNVELRKFREALEHCEQSLTDSPLRVSQETVPGIVKNFIADFKDFTANLPPGSSSYGVANYVTAAPAMKLLDPEMALALRRILEAYAWCLVGVYSEQEIRVYESEREQLMDNFANIVAGIKNTESSVAEVGQARQARSGPPPLQANVDQRYVPELNPQRLEATPLPKEIKIDSITPTSNQPSKTPLTPSPKPRPKPVIAAVPKKVVSKGQPLGIHRQPTEITTPANPYHKQVNPVLAPSKGGVVRDDTNIKITDELQRIEKEKIKQASLIQKKLLELRQRNQADDKASEDKQ